MLAAERLKLAVEQLDEEVLDLTVRLREARKRLKKLRELSELKLADIFDDVRETEHAP